MPTFEIDTDQGVFEIDADREPTLEEAQRIISGQTQQAAPAVQRDLSVVPQDFRQQFMAEAQTPVAQRVASALGGAVTMPFEVGAAIVNQLVRAGKGGLQAPAAMLGTEVARIEQDPLQIFSAPGRLASQAAQSGLEAAVRIPTDVIRSIPEIPKLIPAANVLEAVRPRDTSEAALEGAYQNLLRNQAFEKIREEGLAPEIFGQQVPQLTEAIETFAPIPGVGPARITARGGAVTRAVKETFGSIPRVGDYVKKSKNILTDLVKPTASEANIMGKLDSGAYTSVLPDLEKNFKANTGVEGFLESTSKTTDEIMGEARPAIKTAAPITDIERQNILTDIDTRLQKAIPNPETRMLELNSDPEILSDVVSLTNDNILDYQRRNNKRIGNFYKNPDKSRPDSIYVLRAARDVISNVIKDRLKSQGVDPVNYSKTGLIHELQDQIGDRFLKAKTELSETLGKGVLPAAAQAAIESRSLVGGAAGPVKEVLTPLTRAEVGRLDRQVNRMFRSIRPIKLSAADKELLVRPALIAEEEEELTQSDLDEAIDASLRGQ